MGFLCAAAAVEIFVAIVVAGARRREACVRCMDCGLRVPKGAARINAYGLGVCDRCWRHRHPCG